MTTQRRLRAARTLILVIAVLGPKTLYAQGAPLHASAMMSAASEAEPSSVRLLVGRSTLIEVGTPISRVSLTSPEIADALVTTPTQLLVNGKIPGTISMFVWDRSGAIRRYEVIVQRDLARLNEQLRQLFPNARIEAVSNGRSVVLSGTISEKDGIDRIIDVAAGYVEKKEEVVSLLKLQESQMSNQVLLRVRFAEVSRTALTELGISYFTGAAGYKDYLGRLTTQQYPSPTFDNSDPNNPKLVFSDFLNFFLFSTKNQLGTVIKALQTKGLFQSLAEPNLVAESGKEASFLAGGEFPVPIAQPSGGGVAITIMYKEFGIRLNFTPTINGDHVHLKVRPEVSSLDYANAITLQGFRIPALNTRRTETELELADGQTFAIAGLLDNTATKTLQKIPGIGDIPVLGLLFKSTSVQKDHSELVVMITPEILPKSSPGVTTALPRLVEPYVSPIPADKLHDNPAPAFKTPQTGGDQSGADAKKDSKKSQPKSNQDSAAATMQALTPSGPKMIQTPPASTAQAAPAPTAPAQAAPAQSRPLTKDEQAALDRARVQQQQAQQQKALQAQQQLPMDQQKPAPPADSKEAKKLAEKQDEAARKQAVADAKLAEEMKKQAQKDQEAQDKAAKKQAEKDAEAAKKAGEAARKQAEIDKKNQKSIDEAAAKLKAAEAAYQAELAKKNPQDPKKDPKDPKSNPQQ